MSKEYTHEDAIRYKAQRDKAREELKSVQVGYGEASQRMNVLQSIVNEQVRQLDLLVKEFRELKDKYE